VLGVDHSVEAIREAWGLQVSEPAEFMVGDLHEVGRLAMGRRFGAVVSFETLPHLQDRARFVAGAARLLETDGVFICEVYYQPTARFARRIRRMLGRQVLPPPRDPASADSYPGDYVIAPIQQTRLPWAPTTLLAICRR
jgi:SAM-dependent methyltransferase